MKVNELKKILNSIEFDDVDDIRIETKGGFLARITGVWTDSNQAPYNALTIKTDQIL